MKMPEDCSTFDLSNTVFVVEGTSDVAFLSSFLSAEYVVTNGSALTKETIAYIKEINKTKNVIVLTDPDCPGRRLRSILDEEIPGLKHVFLPKDKCRKKHKLGVAESDKETVLEALGYPVIMNKGVVGELVLSDLFDLGLTGTPKANDLRNKIALKLHLGECNCKTFLKRCNSIGITKEKLKEAING